VSEHAGVAGFRNAFGKYQLVERLDDIEIGEVHVAKLVGVAGFEKRVVIWRLGETPTHVPGLTKIVMLEATRGASLSHANLAQVLDVGTVDGVCFVATEHVSGPTLEDVLRVRKTLPWPVAAHIAGEVAAALSYAHGRRTSNGELLRLVHRRLAPRRIALSSGGDVKLTGFGTSWAWPHPDEYRSPEEARCEPVDGRADVFALGAVLVRCLPRTGVPEALRDAVQRALRAYPEHRSTAAELQRDLVQILHGADRPVAPRDLTELAVGTAAFRR
jgi:serine/threonine-protein kinase